MLQSWRLRSQHYRHYMGITVCVCDSFVEFARTPERAHARVERQYKIKTNSARAHAGSRIKKIYSIVKRYVVFI